jgi:hypothetical protein
MLVGLSLGLPVSTPSCKWIGVGGIGVHTLMMCGTWWADVPKLFELILCWLLVIDDWGLGKCEWELELSSSWANWIALMASSRRALVAPKSRSS